MERVDFRQAAEFLKSCEDVYILIHHSPDGDCIGSGFSLQAVLRQMGKRAKVLCADPIPEKYAYLLPEQGEEDFPPKNIVSVDVADSKLFGCYCEAYGDKVELCIDHHVSNTGYAQKLLLEADAAAACEVLYGLYKYMGVELTEQMAACLYTGIATDTGCFKFSNTTPVTHRYAAELMERFPDLDYAHINRIMFDIKSPSRMRAEMLMLGRMEFYLDGRCTMIAATQELFDETGMDPKDTEGMTNLPLQLEGVEVGITIREKEPGAYKVSMRSANDANVSAICQTLGGGGHVKAAGCLLKGDIAEIKATLVEAVRKGLDGA